MKELSIIIPTFNYAHLLTRAVDSVMSQISSNAELIIIDDGSTDDTEKVLKELQRKYPESLRVYKKKNGGAASARNAGVLASKAEYLLFLDADDELIAGTISEIKSVIKTSKEIDLFLSGHITINEDGVLREHFIGPINANKSKNFIAYIKKQLPMSHGAFVVKRKQFEHITYPENLKNSEDIPVFGQLLASSTVATISKPLVTIYKHEGSLRNQLFTDDSEAMDVVESLFNPNILPFELLRYKAYYAARRALSLSRSNYLAMNFTESRKWYVRALSYDSIVIFEWSYLRKFIKSFFKKEVNA